MIAANCYTMRELLKDVSEAERNLTRLREAGCTAVQVSGFYHLKGPEIAGLLRDVGLSACGSHIQFERLRDDLAGAVEDLASWQCTDVSVPVMPAEFRSASGVKRFAGEMNELGARLKEHAVRLTYHNHSFEMERAGDRTWLRTLYDLTDPALVHGEIDTYWIQHGGGDPVAWIRSLKGRLPLLHVKDMGIVDLKQCDMPVGDGNLDWDGILAAAADAGVEWYIIEQDDPVGDPVECIARSVRFLSSRL